MNRRKFIKSTINWVIGISALPLVGLIPKKRRVGASPALGAPYTITTTPTRGCLIIKGDIDEYQLRKLREEYFKQIRGAK